MKKFFIKKNITIKKALETLNNIGRKCLIAVDSNNKLVGTLSDGDLRKAIIKGKNLNFKIEKIINRTPLFLEENKFDQKKLQSIFSKYIIDLVPVVNSNKKVTNIIFWEDTIKTSKKINKKIKHRHIPVVIMAGGMGNRLKPFTNILPKPLIPVKGKTIIERIISNFYKFGFKDYKFIVNYKSLILKAYLKELKTSINIEYFAEKKPLGTIGGLYLLKSKIKENIILSNCDIIVNCDLNDLIQTHIDSKNILTIVAATKEFVMPYGNCVLNEDGNLKYIDEKPKSNYLINTGLYIINKKIFKYLKRDSVLNMDKLITNLLNSKLKVGIFPVHESQWIDIGEWSEYKKTVEKF